MRDVGQHRAHARRIGIQRLMKMTPRVRPTGNLHQASFRLGEEAVVSPIRIGLQIAPIMFQKDFGTGAFACRRFPPPSNSARTALGEHTEDRATPPIAASSRTWSGLECPRRSAATFSPAGVRAGDRLFC